VCFIGAYCSHPTKAEIDPAVVDTIANTATEHITIACHARKHTWVIVVGTVDEYLDYDVKPRRIGKVADEKGKGADTVASTESTAAPAAVKLNPLDAFAQRCLSMRIVQAGEAMGDGDVEVEDQVEGVMSRTGDV